MFPPFKLTNMVSVFQLDSDEYILLFAWLLLPPLKLTSLNTLHLKISPRPKFPLSMCQPQANLVTVPYSLSSYICSTCHSVPKLSLYIFPPPLNEELLNNMIMSSFSLFLQIWHNRHLIKTFAWRKTWKNILKNNKSLIDVILIRRLQSQLWMLWNLMPHSQYHSDILRHTTKKKKHTTSFFSVLHNLF